MNINEEVTCSHMHVHRCWVLCGMMNVLLLGFSVEPLCLRRVISDVGRDGGYKELTTNQVDAITAFLHGKDVFISLLTGSGKSVCFTLLPNVVDAIKPVVGVPCKRKSISVVISPLISLMENQSA